MPAHRPHDRSGPGIQARVTGGALYGTPIGRMVSTRATYSAAASKCGQGGTNAASADVTGRLRERRDPAPDQVRHGKLVGVQELK